jgi:type IV pilus assembly protein PilP
MTLLAAALLGACGSDEHGDLKQELSLLTKDVRGRVEPLPAVRPYEPVPYSSEGQIDPFRPERIEVAKTSGPPALKGRAPDTSRPKEPLEAFPLEAIQMLGTITQNQETFALVKAGANLYRVKKGNYMGHNFGVITAIDDSQIALKEIVQDGGGEWVERQGSLQLVEARR